ncbi:MAG: YbaK/EbsC family protein [Candidatus Zixiibacteriota bacterium]
MSKPLFETIKNFLDENGIAYRSVHHEPTHTSEESAKARGEDVKIGGKAILMKVGDVFRLFVLSAALKIDSDSLKQRFGVKALRFANAEELLDFTGLVPGSVPPFGFPILPFDLYVDKSILNNEKIAFNAGSLTDSIVMRVSDYLKVADATVLEFSKDNQDFQIN